MYICVHVCKIISYMYTYVYTYIYIYMTTCLTLLVYTQFRILCLGIVGPNPWKLLAQIVYLRVSRQPNPWSKSYIGHDCDGIGV